MAPTFASVLDRVRRLRDIALAQRACAEAGDLANYGRLLEAWKGAADVLGDVGLAGAEGLDLLLETQAALAACTAALERQRERARADLSGLHVYRRAARAYIGLSVAHRLG